MSDWRRRWKEQRVKYVTCRVLARYKRTGRERDGYSGVILGAKVCVDEDDRAKITVYGPSPGSCPILIKWLTEDVPPRVKEIAVGTKLAGR